MTKLLKHTFMLVFHEVSYAITFSLRDTQYENVETDKENKWEPEKENAETRMFCQLCVMSTELIVIEICIVHCSANEWYLLHIPINSPIFHAGNQSNNGKFVHDKLYFPSYHIQLKTLIIFMSF